MAVRFPWQQWSYYHSHLNLHLLPALRHGYFQSPACAWTQRTVVEAPVVAIELEAQVNCAFRGNERDVLELMGMLMDNACKYGRARVRVIARGGGAQSLKISVEDDGNGIPASAWNFPGSE